MGLSTIAKRMILVTGICVLLFVIGSIIFYRSAAFLPFALGALMGGGANALKTFLLDRAVTKSAAMEAGAAGNYIRAQYFLRFILTGGVLALAVTVPFINLWGAAAGILTMPISAYVMRFKFWDKNKSTPETEKGG